MRAKPSLQKIKTFDRDRMSDLLFQGLKEIPRQLKQPQFEQLLDYLALLNKWNGVYNLTAVRDPDAMIQLHLLDSLAVLNAFDKSHRILDVGSGGGLPGIVLAIANPELKVEMIDAVHKKTAFLNQVKAELGLENVEVHAGRVENLQTDALFDTITSRAFAALGDMVLLTQHLLAPGGQYIAMKGAVPKDEIEELPPGWIVHEVRAIKVPGMNAERHLIFIRRDKP